MQRYRRTTISRAAVVVCLAATGALLTVSPAQAEESFTVIDVGTGSGPQDIAITPDGALIFVALEDVDTVRVLDGFNHDFIADITVGDAPVKVTISPDGTLAYVVSSGADQIDVISVGTLALTGSPIPALNFPTDVAFTPDGATAFIAGYGSNTISVVDVTTATVSDTVLGLANPQGIEVSPDGATLWIVGGSSVTPMDIATLTVGTSANMGDTDYPSAQPRFLDMSPDGSTLAVSGDGSPRVYIFDTASETVIDHVDVGDSSYSLSYSPDGLKLYAGLATVGGVVVIDTLTDSVIETVPTIGLDIRGLALSPRGDFGYAANVDDGSIMVFGDPVFRVSGSDRYAVAINISQRAYPSSAEVVYVATGANYPDALSAGPAAAVDHGPLLLTPKASVPAAVLAEIVRLSPADIYIVGGTGSVSDNVKTQLEAIVGAGQVHRLAGADRYAASRAIVEHAFATATTVYITTGRNFPDALSASAIGAGVRAPVLLVDGLKSTVDAPTLALLAALNPTTIKIAGGPGSVSPGIESQLAGLYSTVRLSGADRYSASLAINQDAFTTSTRVFVATGATFPDALAGAPWAGLVDAPLFSVPKTCIPADTLAEIVSLGAYQVTLLGGPGSLTQSVFDLTPCA